MLSRQSSRAEWGSVKGVAVRVGGREGCPSATRTTCPHMIVVATDARRTQHAFSSAGAATEATDDSTLSEGIGWIAT